MDMVNGLLDLYLNLTERIVVAIEGSEEIDCGDRFGFAIRFACGDSRRFLRLVAWQRWRLQRWGGDFCKWIGGLKHEFFHFFVVGFSMTLCIHCFGVFFRFFLCALLMAFGWLRFAKTIRNDWVGPLQLQVLNRPAGISAPLFVLHRLTALWLNQITCLVATGA